MWGIIVSQIFINDMHVLLACFIWTVLIVFINYLCNIYIKVFYAYTFMFSFWMTHGYCSYPAVHTPYIGEHLCNQIPSSGKVLFTHILINYFFIFFPLSISMPNVGLKVMTPRSRVTCSTNQLQCMHFTDILFLLNK